MELSLGSLMTDILGQSALKGFGKQPREGRVGLIEPTLPRTGTWACIAYIIILIYTIIALKVLAYSSGSGSVMVVLSNYQEKGMKELTRVPQLAVPEHRDDDQ